MVMEQEFDRPPLSADASGEMDSVLRLLRQGGMKVRDQQQVVVKTQADCPVEGAVVELDERTLTEAFEHRELVRAMMEHDGLGLELLAMVREKGQTVWPDILTQVNRLPADAAGAVEKLIHFGALSGNLEEMLECTALGRDLLANLERSTGISFAPESAGHSQ